MPVLDEAYESIFNQVLEHGLYVISVSMTQEGYFEKESDFIDSLTHPTKGILQFLEREDRFEDCALLMKMIKKVKENRKYLWHE